MSIRAGLLVVFAVAAVARAGERKIAEGDVPEPVLAAVARKYPAAKRLAYARETERGVVTYEVELADGARRVDVDLAPDGKIRAEEEALAVDAIPAAVSTGLAASAKYAGWKATRAERVITDEKNDAPTYELVLAKGKKRVEVVFDSAGKIVRD